MDYFKIFTIIFMIFITYKLYFNESKLEGFEGTQQSLGGVDDTNAINTLAQIAKNLMAGGVTVPGAINLFNSKTKFSLVNDPDNCFRIKDDRGAQVLAINDGGSIYSKGDGFILSGNDMTVKGNVSVGADLTFPNQTTIKGAGRLHIGGGELLYLLNKSGVMIGKEWGGNGNLVVQGELIAQGRNILAELNECVKFNQQFKMSISDNRGGASGGASANMIGACNPECGGGARIVSTNEPGRQLGLQINRW